MRNKYEQMSLFYIYKDVEIHLENEASEIFRLLDELFDWDEIIPISFHNAFYKYFGRS